jgi:hypothetical protein
MKKHFVNLYQNTIKLDGMPADAVLDQGCYATLRKKARNTNPVSRPLQFGDVIHMDIVFGPEMAIGNVHYGLLLSDCFSRMNYLYPLHNLLRPYWNYSEEVNLRFRYQTDRWCCT